MTTYLNALLKESYKSLTFLQAFRKANYFPDLRLIINDVAARRIPKNLYQDPFLSLNQVFFIEALKEIYNLPMGRPVCDFLMKIPKRVEIFFNGKASNFYIPFYKQLHFNLLLPVYLSVEKNEKHHFERCPRICAVYHELLHVMHDFSPKGMQLGVRMEQWGSLEEYLTIKGLSKKYCFSENNLREYLGLFPRAKYSGGTHTILFQKPYDAIEGLLYYDAYGNLESYLKIAQPSFNEIYETNFIYYAVHYGQIEFARMLIDYVLNNASSPMSAEEFMEKAIEDRRFELLLVLHKLSYI